MVAHSNHASGIPPDPSLSRQLQSPDCQPKLYHSLFQRKNSILSLAADDHNIYSGSQIDDILVWDKATFSLKTMLKGHTASVLALEYAAEKKWLFSASGDSTIRVWCTRTFQPLFILSPYMDTESGDLFSLTWSPTLSTIYVGCQNTSLQWFTFPPESVASTPNIPSTPTPSIVSSELMDSDGSNAGNASGTSTPRRVHKFFDSYPQYTRRPADLNARNNATQQSSRSTSQVSNCKGDDNCVAPTDLKVETPTLQIPPSNVIWSAHYGYVYCTALSPSIREGSDDWPASRADHVRLLTGSGDATVKLWSLPNGIPTIQHTFDCGSGAVLALVVRGDTIYAGCQDGYVKVWDIETRTLVRSIIVVENVDVLSLSMVHSDLYTCSANGQVQRWSASFDLTASWMAHTGIVLSSIVTKSERPLIPTHDPDSAGKQADNSLLLITGANDDHIKVWEVEAPMADYRGDLDTVNNRGPSDAIGDTLVYALSKFVSIPSVSACPSNREDCRQAAIWLRKCFNQLGAVSTLLPTGDDTSPLVLGTFHGAQAQTKKRILFYGHYDVIPAPSKGWDSKPFELTALNGYLYGRGVNDDKGPIIAVACAAAELLRKRALDVDLVLLIEGEEEAGSRGFDATVAKHKDAIGPIDAILVSNSVWISETTPCITYGLRGVVHCQVEISSSGIDLHSGVDGGAVAEPMTDMVKLLSTLTGECQRVAIPGFYDTVRPLTDEERQLYKVLSGVTQSPASALSAKWREPSLTVHSIEVSGPSNSTVIPATVKSRLSIRIVPDQQLDQVVQSLQDYLNSEFDKLQSPNTLQVAINHTADWWLGKLDDPWFTALEDAIRDEWGVEPLRIREGGSIPSIPYLEKQFSCHALHLPMGQSTDQAHLANERMSLANLQRGKSVVERFLTNVAKNIA